MSDVQIAIIDQENIEVNLAVPGIQGAKGDTGTVAVALDGTAAAPGISFASDTNTGIYRPGADQLAISTGGTGRLFVDASGNIGINKTPGFALDVKGGYQTTVARFLRLADYGEIIRIGRDGVSETASINYPTDGVFAINTAGAERARIRADGLFEVKGAGTAGSSPAFSVSGSAPANSCQLDSSGRLLVGTTTANGFITAYKRGAADQTFHIENGTTASGIDYAIAKTLKLNLIHGGKNGGNDNGWQLNSGCGAGEVTNNGYLAVSKLTTQDGSASSEVLRINSTGNVGIGTTGPEALLTIGQLALSPFGGAPTYRGDVILNQSGSATGLNANGGIEFKIDGTNNGYGARLLQAFNGVDGYNFALQTRHSSATWSTPLLVTRQGNVGIGTVSPAQALDVKTASGDCYISASRASQSAGQVALKLGGGTSGTDWIIYQETSSNDLRFFGNSSTRMVIDSTGRVGIGTTSPTQKVQITDGSLSNFYIAPGYNSGTGTLLATGGSEYLAFATNGLTNERARIDSSGRLLVGTTSAILGVACPLQVSATANAVFLRGGASGSDVLAILNAATTGDNIFVNFGTEAGFTARGTIDYNRAAGQVRYNVTSDRRLKSDIQPAASALDSLSALQVRAYKWTETDYQVNYGFIAQELNEIVPDAVKVGDDGEEVADAWSVDTGKLVPLLTKALQEAIERIETLEAKVAALEAQ